MPQAGGLLWGGDDGVEAEHRHEQNGHKGDRNQESVQAGLKNALVHERLKFFSMRSSSYSLCGYRSKIRDHS
jgi:hypothetical protein